MLEQQAGSHADRAPGGGPEQALSENIAGAAALGAEEPLLDALAALLACTAGALRLRGRCAVLLAELEAPRTQAHFARVGAAP